MMETTREMKRRTIDITLPDRDFSVRSKLHNFTTALGIKSEHKGAGYILEAGEAILAARRAGHAFADISMIHLCASIGERHNKSWQSVERTMRYTIEYCFNEGNSELLEAVFGGTISCESGKVTTKAFLCGLIAYLFEEAL